MESYEINEDTLALIPKDDDITTVYEVDGRRIILNNTYKIMEESCEYYGSTFEGRKMGTKNITGLTHKVPIIVEESNGLVFFPTKSSNDKDCAWISLNHIDYYEKNKGYCFIYFKDGSKVKLKTSYTVINNQVLRASNLLLKLIQRQNSKKTQKKLKNNVIL